jgi:hypothetical protein
MNNGMVRIITSKKIRSPNNPGSSLSQMDETAALRNI